MNSRLLLVDGHAYAYRAYYAIRNLRSPEGRATNAIYGFVKMLGRMRELVSPTHLAVVWDGGLSEERLGLIPDYKAQRPEMPDELDEQLGEIQAYLKGAGVRSLQSSGVEADDWIGGLTQEASKQGFSVVIASSDKDFFQLVSDGVGILNPNDKSNGIWSRDQVRGKTGVEPEQIVDWLSLVGDAVDNIPGVPGVGPKTAASLLQKFGSIDAIFVRLCEIEREQLRLMLAKSEPQVRMNQKMIRLDCGAAPGCELGDLVVGKPDLESLLQLARKWGFQTMAREISEAMNEQQVLL